MDPKLTEEGWKAVVAKNKLKDKDLQKALFSYWALEDDDFDWRLKWLDKIASLAATLKKNKEVAALPDVVKYLTQMVAAAGAEEGDVTKAKALAAKTAVVAQKKAGADAKKGDGEGEDAGAEEEEEDEEGGEYQEVLIAAFKKLKSGKDATFEFIVCDAKPYCGLMLARKISPKHKEQLTKVTGSKRFLHLGTCRVVDGKFNFATENAVPGLAKKLQASIKNYTGKKLPIVVGTESAEAGEDSPSNATNPDGRPAAADAPAEAPSPAAGAPAPQPPAGGAFSITASVGRGGKNKPQDVMAVQTALNNKTKAGLKVDGKVGPKTIGAIEALQKTIGQNKPDGRIDPGRGTARALASSGALPAAPPAPQPIAPPKLGKAELAKAPDVWRSTRAILDKNIDELKKAILGHYANEHPDLLKEIDQNMGKLDAIMDKLDHRLAESLAKANAAANEAARKAELKNSKTILADYIKYVKSEPLIKHIDSNPFGVATNLMKVLTDSLTHMAQSIG